MLDFKNIEYLKTGNRKQQLAYKEITELNIFSSLLKYKPILTGTIPIEINIPESDLDIICECQNHDKFKEDLTKLFGKQNNFSISTKLHKGITSTIAEFTGKYFIIEIFGQNMPVEKQNAYRHMLIEHQILLKKDSEFRNRVIELKKSGIKTEPAFAQLLGIEGNPYDELLKL